MFRPNRIGTPVIHTSTANDNADNYTEGEALWTAVGQPFNVINASPVLDFGRSQLNWNGTKNFAALTETALVQQVTVTEPLAGDTVGLELNGSITFLGNQNSVLRPVFFKMSAALGTVLANGSSADAVTQIGPALMPDRTAGGSLRSHWYKETIIFRGTAGSIGGTYAHGFAILDNSNAAWTMNWFDMMASVRQLNDQQSIGYRDTLR